MFSFSNISKERLLSCHRDLQVLFDYVITHYDCSVICGHREEDAQNKAFKEGNSTLTFPKSKHNSIPSIAVDVAPYPIDWDDLKRFYSFGGFVTGVAQSFFDSGVMDYRIRWGGDWDGDFDFKDQRFNDLPHFELIGV